MEVKAIEFTGIVQYNYFEPGEKVKLIPPMRDEQPVRTDNWAGFKYIKTPDVIEYTVDHTSEPVASEDIGLVFLKDIPHGFNSNNFMPYSEDDSDRFSIDW